MTANYRGAEEKRALELLALFVRYLDAHLSHGSSLSIGTEGTLRDTKVFLERIGYDDVPERSAR